MFLTENIKHRVSLNIIKQLISSPNKIDRQSTILLRNLHITSAIF